MNGQTTEQPKRRAGKPRQYPQCPRYRSHVFSPDTNRCPCGFQRPGTDEVAKAAPLVLASFRLPASTLQELERIAVELDKPVSEVMRDALIAFINGRGF